MQAIRRGGRDSLLSAPLVVHMARHDHFLRMLLCPQTYERYKRVTVCNTEQVQVEWTEMFPLSHEEQVLPTPNQRSSLSGMTLRQLQKLVRLVVGRGLGTSDQLRAAASAGTVFTAWGTLTITRRAGGTCFPSTFTAAVIVSASLAVRSWALPVLPACTSTMECGIAALDAGEWCA